MGGARRVCVCMASNDPFEIADPGGGWLVQDVTWRRATLFSGLPGAWGKRFWSRSCWGFEDGGFLLYTTQTLHVCHICLR